MNYKEQLLLAELLEKSKCEKCNTQMQFIPAPIYQLDKGMQDLIIQERLSYRAVECPNCESRGLHLYKI